MYLTAMEKKSSFVVHNSLLASGNVADSAKLSLADAKPWQT